MIKSRPEKVKLVKTVETMETVQTVKTVETVQIVETVETVGPLMTDNKQERLTQLKNIFLQGDEY